MPRYIDADKLIAEYGRVHIGAPGGARKLMENAPTADVVEVVRCCDCMYHDDICKHPDGLFRTTDNSYCSFGKRKEKK